MNNKFDFKRFAQVLKRDWSIYFRNYGISLIVWCALPILLWFVTLVFEVEMGRDPRAAFIFSFIIGALLFVPSKVYGKANLSRDGVSFAMLPATHSEKFFSMVLYCSILTPLIVGLGSWLVDSILTLLPFGGFNEYIVLQKEGLGMLALTVFCFDLAISALFLFGNMMFTKRKPGKTIAWSMLALFVITLVFQLFHFWDVIDQWLLNMNHQAPQWILNITLLVIAIVFYVLTYRKIKTQKY